MGKIEQIKTCSQCEHFGDGRFPVVNYFFDGELKSEFIGFSDRLNGAVCEHFSHKCEIHQNILVYDDSHCCKDFTPKTWERPLTCSDCSCCKQYYNDFSFFTCSNFPFYKYHKNDNKACPNGKARKQTNYTLFDLLK